MHNPPPRSPSAHRSVRRLTFAAALLLNLAVLYAPDPGAPAASVPGLDKVVHMAVFLALTLAGLWAGLPPRWFLPLVLVHAVSSEIVQSELLSGRQGDPWDAVADVVGIGLAYVIRRGARARPPRQGPGGR